MAPNKIIIDTDPVRKKPAGELQTTVP
jgi:hypothetical protein